MMQEAASVMQRPASGSDTRPPGRWTHGLSCVVALSVAIVLQIAALAKIAGPDKKKVLIRPGEWGLESGMLLDHAVAIVEIAAIMLLLLFHRTRIMWLATALLFSGFFGYALYWFVRNQSCGCFGTLLVGTPLEFFTVRGVSLGLDAAFFLLALLVALLRGVKGKWLIVTATAGLLLAVGGFIYAWQTAPPRPEEFQKQLPRNVESLPAPIAEKVQAGETVTPMEVLAASDMMKEARDASSAAPDKLFYIFVYNPDCEHCMQMMGPVTFQRDLFENNPGEPVRVRLYAIPEIKAQLGIEDWAWPGTPTVFFMRNGQVVQKDGKPHVRHGVQAPLPNDVKTEALTGAL